MRAHCLQHVAFEGMGAIETWLHQNQFEVSHTHLYESVDLPAISEIDWVIIMGGPMSVNDEQAYPWLVTEKEFIRKCIAANKVVLGICLGAQLISSALGSAIYQNKEKEIGWFPLKKSETLKSKLFRDFPDDLTVFHWHGETFDLPKNAELIASSETCKNQVFSVNDRVIGFQCHLETTDQSLRSLITNCRDELKPGTYIQSEDNMIEHEKRYAPAMQHELVGILNALFREY